MKTQSLTGSAFKGGGSAIPSPSSLPAIKPPARGVLDTASEFGSAVLGSAVNGLVKGAVRTVAGDEYLASRSFDRDVEPGESFAEQRAQNPLGIDFASPTVQIALAAGAVGLFLLMRR